MDKKAKAKGICRHATAVGRTPCCGVTYLCAQLNTKVSAKRCRQCEQWEPVEPVSQEEP